MKNIKLVKKYEPEVESIKCDRCKTTYSDMIELQEFHCIDYIGGYGSIFGDNMRIQCELCQYCLSEMIEGYFRREEI